MSQSDPTWLKKYYRKAFEELHPTIVEEGKSKAIVRLTKQVPRGFSGVGYVLVDKNGTYNVTPHLSLHEGVPTQADFNRMREVLAQNDK